jgi:hypothetical protein
MACGRMGVWAYGRMGVWAYGRMGVWAYGRMGVWAYGRLGGWACGPVGRKSRRGLDEAPTWGVAAPDLSCGAGRGSTQEPLLGKDARSRSIPSEWNYSYT